MYATEEERMKSLRASRNKYQKNKEWYCDICRNGNNYTIRGKYSHQKTKLHNKNAQEANSQASLVNTQFVDDLIIIKIFFKKSILKNYILKICKRE